MRSKLTLEPLQTPEQIFASMVDLYALEYGFADLYDVYKVLLPIKPESIGIQLFSAIEDRNEADMVKEGLCPDCATKLVMRVTPATRTEPRETWTECPECRTEHKGVAS